MTETVFDLTVHCFSLRHNRVCTLLLYLSLPSHTKIVRHLWARETDYGTPLGPENESQYHYLKSRQGLFRLLVVRYLNS